MYSTVKPPSFYNVGIYIRLSQEDEDKAHKRESESESVLNQRSLIMNYLRDNGFVLTDEYVDDGYSGTNFDRPAFKRLLEDIEKGKINCVITKDLSRLGRDYIKCGYYIEQYFPLKKVRYISILDNVDTFLDSANNDIAPFKALFNDMTSKDTSKKIKSILKTDFSSSWHTIIAEVPKKHNKSYSIDLSNRITLIRWNKINPPPKWLQTIFEM